LKLSIEPGSNQGVPELPDIELYRHALTARLVGHPLERVRLASPFLLRSVAPPLSAIHGRTVREIRRLGKRLVFALADQPGGALFLVLHLMIAGRLRWKEPGAKVPGRLGLVAFDFDHGTLLLTEAGTKKRASLHVVADEEALALHDPGGLEVLETDRTTFERALRLENHTLKRALTDPRIFSGIGNAYSDEILHRAKLSPFLRTANLGDAECGRLFDAVQTVLREWVARLREEAGDQFPEKVTAFRPEMAVHGKYGEPCPVCGTPVQRIVYAENEANYCTRCQTGGKLLADRALSQLLKGDWPRTLEELELRKKGVAPS
jgi:formamidopyrimidine-DNA glycosylase